MTDILVAAISSIIGFCGVLVTVIVGQRKTSKDIKSQSDLTLYRIEQLEVKQDKHNTLIERMYRIEDRTDDMTSHINDIEHKIENLESLHRK